MLKFAFLDCEFTGEHAFTTLVSLGIVGSGEEELYLTFDDYEKDQVTPWLEKNVLTYIDSSTCVSKREGFQILKKWLEEYSQGNPVSLITVGKTSDLTLLFELWHYEFPMRKYFHALHCLPKYLNHSSHFDLPTMFYLAGLDPEMNRENFVKELQLSGKRHDALYDAKVVKACFNKIYNANNFPRIQQC